MLHHQVTRAGGDAVGRDAFEVVVLVALSGQPVLAALRSHVESIG
jgi:hypothetical protein